jgi:phage-related protein
VKEVHWIGNSRATVRAFLKGARLKVAQELTRVQLAAGPKHGKALPQVGRGVQHG